MTLDQDRKRESWRSEARTDLAVEALPGERPCPGVRIEERESDVARVTRVFVEDEVGARSMGKPPGVYVTIEAQGLRRTSRSTQEQIAVEFAREICGMLPGGPDGAVLIVGLGNWNATPDALGPRVVHDILITRHLYDQVPAEKRGSLRQVAALAPGVLGLTGIETGEVIRGVIDRIAPDFVIAVDALASRSIARIGTTIQLTDTGITPGSGVGNRRVGLTSQTLGVPVLAIGVPTVVHARTIAWDVLDALEERSRTDFRYMGGLDRLGREQRSQLIDDVLIPTVGDLMVTPKEIDVLINEVSRVIAGGLNVALHPGIDADELASYIQ
jgi:spore protease